MSVTRRAVCFCGAFGLAALAEGSAFAAPYLEDPRTARAVTLRAPRTTLGECLRVVSAAVEVELTAAPELSREAVVAYVPRRTLRETMSAIEELFDGRWVESGGKFRLEPDPVRYPARRNAHRAALAKIRKTLDDQSALVMKRLKTEPLPPDQDSQRQLFPVVLWSFLTPDQRMQVLKGTRVSIAIPEPQAKPVYELTVSMALKEPGKLVEPLLATFDLDDRNELANPTLRVRATGRRADSVVGAIHSVDLSTALEAPKPQPAPNGPILPENLGGRGRIGGTRDELILALGEAANLPVLSRQRAQGGSGPALVIGGRTLSQVMEDLGAACDVTVTANSRGFFLCRSNTEALDGAGSLPESIMDYVRRRPEKGKVISFDLLSELGELTPLQLAVLQRSNLCTPETIAAREIYTVLRFYRSLTPAQRQAIFTADGLEAAGLSHAQLHALLDEKAKRGNWEVHGPLQEIKGLRFRFERASVDGQAAVTFVCLRDGNELEPPVLVELPKVDEDEEVPTASRG